MDEKKRGLIRGGNLNKKTDPVTCGIFIAGMAAALILLACSVISQNLPSP